VETVDKKIVLELENSGDIIDIIIALSYLSKLTMVKDERLNNLTKRIALQANEILTLEELVQMQGK